MSEVKASGMNPALALVLAIAIAWFAYGQWFQENVWTGIVYPSAANLTIHEEIGEFDSIENCLAAVYDRVNRLSDPNSADFECGLNCKPWDHDPEMMICEETRDTP